MNKLGFANYDKYPATKVEGSVRVGWDAVASVLTEKGPLAVDCYTGVYEDAVEAALAPFFSHTVCGLGVDDSREPVSIQYKRGLFIDWRALDYYREVFSGGELVLDMGAEPSDCWDASHPSVDR